MQFEVKSYYAKPPPKPKQLDQPIVINNPESLLKRDKLNIMSPIVNNITINPSDPFQDHSALAPIIEYLLPISNISGAIATLKDRKLLADFIKNTLLFNEDGIVVDSLKYNIKRLLKSLKTIKLNPYITKQTYGKISPYSMPKNFILYRSCFPIKYIQNTIKCDMNSTQLNLRFYKVMRGEIIERRNKEVIQSSKALSEVEFYKKTKQIIEQNECPNFVLMYGYNFYNDKDIDFDAYNININKPTTKLYNHNLFTMIPDEEKDELNEEITNEIIKYIHKLGYNDINNIIKAQDKEKIKKIYFEYRSTLDNEKMNKLMTMIVLKYLATFDNTIKLLINNKIIKKASRYTDLNDFILMMTESPTYNIYDWASKTFVDNLGVKTMITTGYHSYYQWLSVLFQMIAAYATLMYNEIYIPDFSLQKNIFIKNIENIPSIPKVWKYVVNGIEYYIPNYGDMVLIDSSYTDNDGDDKITIDNPYKTLTMLNSLIESLNPTNFSSNIFLEKGGSPPDDDVIRKMERIYNFCHKLFNTGDTNIFIKVINELFYEFMNNRLGTYLTEEEYQSITSQPTEIIDDTIKSGRFVIYKEDDDAKYKIGIYYKPSEVITNNIIFINDTKTGGADKQVRKTDEELEKEINYDYRYSLNLHQFDINNILHYEEFNKEEKEIFINYYQLMPNIYNEYSCLDLFYMNKSINFTKYNDTSYRDNIAELYNNMIQLHKFINDYIPDEIQKEHEKTDEEQKSDNKHEFYNEFFAAIKNQLEIQQFIQYLTNNKLIPNNKLPVALKQLEELYNYFVNKYKQTVLNIEDDKEKTEKLDNIMHIMNHGNLYDIKLYNIKQLINSTKISYQVIDNKKNNDKTSPFSIKNIKLTDKDYMQLYLMKYIIENKNNLSYIDSTILNNDDIQEKKFVRLDIFENKEMDELNDIELHTKDLFDNLTSVGNFIYLDHEFKSKSIFHVLLYNSFSNTLLYINNYNIRYTSENITPLIAYNIPLFYNPKDNFKFINQSTILYIDKNNDKFIIDLTKPKLYCKSLVTLYNELNRENKDYEFYINNNNYILIKNNDSTNPYSCDKFNNIDVNPDYNYYKLKIDDNNKYTIDTTPKHVYYDPIFNLPFNKPTTIDGKEKQNSYCDFEYNCIYKNKNNVYVYYDEYTNTLKDINIFNYPLLKICLVKENDNIIGYGIIYYDFIKKIWKIKYFNNGIHKNNNINFDNDNKLYYIDVKNNDIINKYYIYYIYDVYDNIIIDKLIVPAQIKHNIYSNKLSRDTIIITPYQPPSVNDINIIQLSNVNDYISDDLVTKIKQTFNEDSINKNNIYKLYPKLKDSNINEDDKQLLKLLFIINTFTPAIQLNLNRLTKDENYKQNVNTIVISYVKFIMKLLENINNTEYTKKFVNYLNDFVNNYRNQLYNNNIITGGVLDDASKKKLEHQLEKINNALNTGQIQTKSKTIKQPSDKDDIVTFIKEQFNDPKTKDTSLLKTLIKIIQQIEPSFGYNPDKNIQLKYTDDKHTDISDSETYVITDKGLQIINNNLVQLINNNIEIKQIDNKTNFNGDRSLLSILGIYNIKSMTNKIHSEKYNNVSKNMKNFIET